MQNQNPAALHQKKKSIIRWGAICEHFYIKNGDIAHTTPVIITAWWEQIILPNLSFTLHAYHHYYPGIPFANLSKVHKIFQQEKLIVEEQIFYGHFSFLLFLLKPSKLIQFSSNLPFHLPRNEEILSHSAWQENIKRIQ